ncbi:hypothetical protein BDV96DRAFT_602047 [Lophiotrema nucula]|uniref:Life-span regulatory factor-domain-containing protein n=1 Tax=Lophiotrema nucula TaxID=690887 RepID=A0A6A5YZU8_9PLEO|nr:hypothetical protein BDV96DRAFT_602047 [Lophiotrema nucula]
MATHHTRHPSNHSKRPLPAHARPSKPAPLTKRSTSHGASKSVQKAALRKEEDLEDEEGMATSFLNFCTYCEKQIVVPNNFVLYCSESCRKKDNEKAKPQEWSPPLTPFGNWSMEDLHFKDIVAPRSPTAPRSQRSSCAFSEISSDDNTGSSDEKQRKDTEASWYLRQFQPASQKGETTATVRQPRPRYNRASTSQATWSAAPSLSHTPASSISYSMPYTPSTRPLPPRTTNSSSYGSRSIDLVTPFSYTSTTTASPPQYSLKTQPTSRTTTSAIEGEILYEKSPIPSMSPANGSLKQLFASTPH